MKRHRLVLDVECYVNYFLIQIMDMDTEEVFTFERSEWTDTSFLDAKELIENNLTVGFNSIKYDIPMIYAAMAGKSNEELVSLSYKLVNGYLQPWEVEQLLGTEFPRLNHIDIIEVAPGVRTSLKIYGGRLHSKKLQDLPLPPESTIKKNQVELLRQYCINDLVTTMDLYNAILPQIKLRSAMGDEYGQDLRSKSDAQIAEAVLKKQIGKITKPNYDDNFSFKYDPPEWMTFVTPQMKDVFEKVCATDFRLSDKGSVQMPPELAGLEVRIGDSIYRMGIGGLHSSENCVCHKAEDGYLLMDADCTSYYPSIMLECGFYPEHIGSIFLDVYREAYETRINAKKRVTELKKEISELKKEFGDGE